MRARQTPVTARQVMIDSSAYFALAERREARHQEARQIVLGLQAARLRLTTTNFVVAEAHALILIRMGRDYAAKFLHEIDRSTTAIVRATVADEQRARAILDQYDDKDFSFTDAISFAVMERLGISHAFTFDRNFTQYGLTVLTPDQF